MDKPTAPAGWGFVPGITLSPSLEDLPELPLLPVLRPSDRLDLLYEILGQHYHVLRVTELEQLAARFPCVSRTAMQELVSAARCSRERRRPRVGARAAIRSNITPARSA